MARKSKDAASASSFISPLRHEDILVKGEKIIYCERQHWASLIQPTFEAASILFAVTILTSGSAPSGAIGGLMILVSAIVLLRLLKNQSKKDLIIYGSLLVLLVAFLQVNIPAIAILIIFFTAGRFVNRFALWAFYEKRYITNRRLLASGGFLGSTISTMPLVRVTDISMGRSLSGEIFDYARLRVESAGQDQALGVIDFLNKPDEFYEKLIMLSTSEAEYDFDEETQRL